MTPEETLRSEWHKFTEEDTRNPNGCSFVIMEDDEKMIADFWLSKFSQERAEDRTTFYEKGRAEGEAKGRELAMKELRERVSGLLVHTPDEVLELNKHLPNTLQDEAYFKARGYTEAIQDVLSLLTNPK